MARYLITGGTGFIGSRLLEHLAASGHEAVVITRNSARYKNRCGEQVSYYKGFDELKSSEVFHTVINLAGEGIGDRRWSEKRKQALYNSRIGMTHSLVEYLSTLSDKPEVMISGSAIGWYGAHDNSPLTEEARSNLEYTHELCEAWEQAAAGVRDLGIRLCIVRLGVVLGQGGGVLKRLLPPFYLGLGGRIGSGQQMMTWVHREDVIHAFDFLVETPSVEGVFNLTAPNAVSNAEFTRQLGKSVHRPTLLPLPGFVVRLVFGEMGDRLLLHGQNVVPARLQDAGFSFRFERLDEAFTDLFS